MPAIEANGLTKIFGRRPQRGVKLLKEGADRARLRREGLTPAVIDATFEVAPGEIFVVMGLSGSGKSTLIRMVNGLLEPTDGVMRIDGQDVTHLSAAGLREVRRTKVSMVFQHFALLPHRTVGENAAYPLKLRGVNKAEREARAEEALALVGLKGWGGSLPSELSGGMRQRVGLARALAAGTDIMLMDEAFSALDPLIRKEMQDQLLELQAELGKTILFITHDLNEAMRLGDRIAMMRDGRVVQVGTSEQILNEPANDYVAQFVADVDRSRVLSAGDVMERPVAVIGPESGPKAAHKLMREHQVSSLLVTGRNRKVSGVVFENDVADAVRQGSDRLPLSGEPVAQVSPDTPLAELFHDAAVSRAPLAVVAEDGRLQGVIPRVTLLSALSVPATDSADTAADGEDPADGEPVLDAAGAK
ncbi:glycine betaine/proline transport system ATP-binding protein [Isoptericola sp. CG 20/1183]|uniref:Glycine betaine/proline transport system ATP-binding protein n=1 Tax=Isoptericola halotolerans TaxID=300560 RepID=A0ABX5EBV6_9MICO|nr:MULTISPECIES: glycine betaine/L-proline ABC transporter ATP-binding protein [Isoptericola]PRZ04926.1 glycine betaine/proline transport system ATP-binding protein [Isoptericola halotolerans]PRZ05417.1 glycine betaine/proline transport system ATP-binding protein [Isoptericola sp. CG 20/1183]